MQAIILAAGKGVRMRPLTDNLPKPLLKIGNKTILDLTITNLPDVIDEIIIVVGYLAEKIKAHVQLHYPNLNVKFVEELETKGTAFAVGVCKDLIHGKFLVINGDDLYSKEDLTKLCQTEWSLLVVKKESIDRFGFLKIDSEGKVIEIISKGESGPGLVNIGAYIIDTQYFNATMQTIASGEYGLPQTLIWMAKNGQPIKAVEAQYWEPVGYPADIERLNAAAIK